MMHKKGITRRIITWFVGWIIILFFVSVGLVLILRWVNPPITAFMVRFKVNAWLHDKTNKTIQYKWVNWDQISPHASLAVIITEDQKFFIHWGFDYESISKAWQRRHRSARLRGGSTISQQVAKNLFLWPKKSYFRKGLEVYFTLMIEMVWPKQRILEVYLNVAQFGDGVFGVEAASEKYFKHPAKRLTPYECALLAAVLPNPLRFKVNRPSNYILKRTDLILHEMYQHKGMSIGR
ncbi:MAG TPA: monofunctional biosynthetic peptidoglycan transglycosylase [Desulfatiglandales bacterium]|nr:monofunctional biosynthetic peptidoglycan transglycosylase [Desulfatiglandales bacterium]